MSLKLKNSLLNVNLERAFLDTVVRELQKIYAQKFLSNNKNEFITLDLLEKLIDNGRKFDSAGKKYLEIHLKHHPRVAFKQPNMYMFKPKYIFKTNDESKNLIKLRDLLIENIYQTKDGKFRFTSEGKISYQDMLDSLPTLDNFLEKYSYKVRVTGREIIYDGRQIGRFIAKSKKNNTFYLTYDAKMDPNPIDNDLLKHDDVPLIENYWHEASVISLSDDQIIKHLQKQGLTVFEPDRR